MNTVDLFYKSFCILKIKVALISCMWSRVSSKAGENNGLIRPPAESVPGLDNREIAPISSPHGIGVEHQTTLTSPFGSELVGVIWLTRCSGYGSFPTAAIKSFFCKPFDPLPSKISPRIWVNIQGIDMCGLVRGKHHVHLNNGLCWSASTRGHHLARRHIVTGADIPNKLPSSQ